MEELLKDVKVIFKTIVGSQAYGTNVEGSDIDIKGVYIQDLMDIATFKYKPQIEINKDEVYYEIRRFIELLSTANPTVLEMLYSPKECVEKCTYEFDYLIENRDMFLTKKCKDSFGGYAVQQIKKARGLNKKMNWEKEQMFRKTPLDFCYVYEDGKSIELRRWLVSKGMLHSYCGIVNIDHIRDGYALYYDIYQRTNPSIKFKGIQEENSNSLKLSSIPKNMEAECFFHYNKDGYSQHCNAYKAYETWLKERNTQRYVDIENHGQQIDGKNMLHCMRLINTAKEIAETGTLNVRRSPEECTYLKSIRHGKVNLEEILTKAEEGIAAMDELFNNSSLPYDTDRAEVNDLLKDIRYRNMYGLLEWDGFETYDDV